MKRLIIFAIIAFAVWYGYKHYDQLLHPRQKHEAVIKNDTGLKIVRLKLTVGGHTYAKEELANGEATTIPFVVDQESEFDLTWDYDTNMSTGHWSGGLVTKGPVVGRHTFTIQEGGGVVMEGEAI